ncbi:hypothetical protein TWF694_005058 [Orbilia ellipsospora]|uniref:Protein phosphatase n=1 Tax=Orbilia ellipsospora TaxID=2528407 RepID=A0AAV9WUS0_9PEZI
MRPDPLFGWLLTVANPSTFPGTYEVPPDLISHIQQNHISCPEFEANAIKELTSSFACRTLRSSTLRSAAPPPPRQPNIFKNATISTHRAFSHHRLFSTSSPSSNSSFQTGFSLYAKRPPRPFPKPWINPPLSSFSEPLSVHSTSLSRRPLYPHQHSLQDTVPSGGSARFLRGYTNGDDALLMHHRYLAVADGVGSWNTRERGYPALWSRLLVHYFSIVCERFFSRQRRKRKPAASSLSSGGGMIEGEEEELNVQNILNEAFSAVVKATSNISPVPSTTTTVGKTTTLTKGTSNKPFIISAPPTSETQRYHGTTTFTGCVLHHNKLHVVNVGDSHCLVLRPSAAPASSPAGTSTNANEGEGFILRTKEGWHYFDCPRQLGTDSPDTPLQNATVSSITVQNGDIVILATDGMLDNIWQEEVISIILRTLSPPSSHQGTGEGDIEWEMELGQMMRKKGRKKVEEGVNVAFREYSNMTRNVYNGDDVDLIGDPEDDEDGAEMMTRVAAELVKAAKVVATDPYAESPWMERALEEGIGAEGGSWMILVWLWGGLWDYSVYSY